jgi:trk system potassium uptake protein TrkH
MKSIKFPWPPRLASKDAPADAKASARRSVLKKTARRAAPSAVQIICASFVLVIAAGTLLLTLPISSRTGRLPLVDAMFTATSATCVTGLVVRDTWSQFSPFGQAVLLLLIQVGGLGLVTLTSFFALAMRRRMGFRDLRLLGESVSADGFSQATGVLKIVVSLALLFEGLGAVLLLFAFVPQYGAEGVWVSVFTAVSAFCNAGFDLFGRFGAYSSLTPYVNNYYVQAVIMFLIIAGGLGFMVWVELATYRKKRHLSLHARVVLSFSAILWAAGTLGFALMEWRNPGTLGPLSFSGKLMASLFQSVSTRTAGMNTVDLAACTPVCKLMMSALMFIGAAPGSTGGGVKVTTFAVLVLTIRSIAQGRDECIIDEHRVDHKTVYRALTIIVLGATAAFVSTVVVYYNTAESISVIDALFESFSAFGTVGLSVGVTAHMNTGAKLLYMLVMFMGRVGPASLAISLASRPDDSRGKILPEGHINVG